MENPENKHSFRLVLDYDRHEALRELAFKMRTSKTALIKEAIDLLLNDNRNFTGNN